MRKARKVTHVFGSDVDQSHESRLIMGIIGLTIWLVGVMGYKYTDCVSPPHLRSD